MQKFGKNNGGGGPPKNGFKKIHGGDETSLLEKARALKEKGESAEAGMLLAKSGKTEEARSEALSCALNCSNKGRHEGAARIYIELSCDDHAIRSLRKSFESMTEVAEWLMEAGRRDLAVKALSRSDTVKAAQMLVEMGEIDLALKSIEKGLDYYGGSIQSNEWKKVARLCSQLGNQDQAKELARAFELGGHSWDIYDAALVYLSIGEKEEALRCLGEILEIKNDNFGLGYAAAILVLAEERERAYEYLSQLQAVEPQNAAPIYISLGDVDKTLECASALREKWPFDAGRIYYVIGRIPEAIEAFKASDNHQHYGEIIEEGGMPHFGCRSLSLKTLRDRE